MFKKYFKPALIICAVLVLAAFINWPSIKKVFHRPNQANAEASNLTGIESPVNIDDIVQIEAGERATLILTKDGKVYGQGDNLFGELASGNKESSQQFYQKIPLPDDVKIKKISFQDSHALALDEEGIVWAWGLNISGQIGDGTNANAYSPKKVLAGATDIGAGYRFSLAVKDNGELWAWGMNCSQDQPGLQEFLKAYAEDISVGGAYFDAVDAPDHVQNCASEANFPIGSTSPKAISGAQNIVSASGGYGHVLAIDRQGQLWTMGCNYYGQLGHGNRDNNDVAKTFTKVDAFGDKKVVQAAAGFRHGTALTEDGELWGWGFNNMGEAGQELIDAIPAPQKVTNVGKVTNLASRHNVTFYIDDDHTAWVYGDNNEQRFDPNNLPVGARKPQVYKPDIRLITIGRQRTFYINTEGS